MSDRSFRDIAGDMAEWEDQERRRATSGRSAMWSLQGEALAATNERQRRFKAVHIAVLGAARKFGVGALDADALDRLTYQLLCDAFYIGEEKGLAARIIEHEGGTR